MRILKQNSLLRLFNSYLVDSPQPSNISYMWNFGSLLALCLGIQIVTGIFLAMHYTPTVDLAFNSVEHIMRNVNYGWLIRYTHANVASFFFIFVYAHIGRGLYYNSYRTPRVAPWSIGVIILILMMATLAVAYLDFSLYNNKINNIQVSSSLAFIAPNIKANLRIGPHSKEFLEILIGGLLGDWWGHPIYNKTYTSYRFQIEQSGDNFLYLQSLANTLFKMGYCKSSDLKDVSREHPKHRLTLFTFSSLYWVYEGFYPNKKSDPNNLSNNIKVIPSWFDEFLTPLSLAHWIMQDGSRQKGQGINIATHSFTHEECVFLADLLNKKFNLKTSVVKTGTLDQWKISVWKRSIVDLADIISPYTVPSMYYKLEGYLPIK